MAYPGSMAGHPTDRWQPRLLSLLLACLLLIMQALLLHHQIDVDHHTNNDHCKLCLHLSVLDHGVSATARPLQANPLPRLKPTLLITTATTPLHNPYQTRAPPSFS